MGQRGLQAYRTQFCSRRLVSEFSSIWITIILFYALLDPVRVLFSRQEARLRRPLKCGSSKKKQQATVIVKADHLQAKLASTLNCIFIFSIFGVLVPPLLVLAPFAVYTNYCSLVQQDQVDHWEQTFGERVVSQLLVHLPLSLFRKLTIIGNVVLTLLIFIDLQFEVQSMVGFAVLCVCVVVGSHVMRHRGGQGQVSKLGVRFRSQGSLPVVEFATVTERNPMVGSRACAKSENKQDLVIFNRYKPIHRGS